jgi:flagellar protein FliO/FliZ
MKIWLYSLLFIAGPLMAEQSANQIPSVDEVSSSYISRIVIGLVLILVLIFLLAWVMKKMQLTPQSGQQLIKIISAISVGHRDRIALIQVGDEQILVGLTPGRIHKLHELKSAVDISHDEDMAPGQFAEKLSRLMNRNKNKSDNNGN